MIDPDHDHDPAPEPRSKPCGRCGEVKPIEDYYTYGGCEEARRGVCKICYCESARTRNHRVRDGEGRRQQRAAVRSCNHRKGRHVPKAEWLAQNAARRQARKLVVLKAVGEGMRTLAEIVRATGFGHQEAARHIGELIANRAVMRRAYTDPEGRRTRCFVIHEEEKAKTPPTFAELVPAQDSPKAYLPSAEDIAKATAKFRDKWPEARWEDQPGQPVPVSYRRVHLPSRDLEPAGGVLQFIKDSAPFSDGGERLGPAGKKRRRA